MIITKEIVVGLDIQDCINILSNPDNVRRLIVDRFEGRCFDSCLIKKVTKIIRMGECLINQDGSPSSGTMSVKFEVQALIYSPDEIINGCVVTKRDPTGMLICQTRDTAIMVPKSPVTTSITQGQIISVRVRGMRYTCKSDKVSVNGVLYVPGQEVTVYKVGDIKDNERPLFSNVLKRIETEEADMVQLKKEKLSAWAFFDNLTYAYKAQQDAPKNAKLLDIKEIVNAGAGSSIYLARDPRIRLTTTGVYAYPSSTMFSPDTTVVDNLPTSNVLLHMLENYCANLRIIREMVEAYGDEEKVIGHKNLWIIFNKAKM